MTEIVEQLLSTKFYQPGARRNLVARPTLFARLQEGLQIPLTLLCAPAGFGKTTLLTSWLEQVRRERDDLVVVWLSLDRDDNDASRFWRYLLAAFEHGYPGLRQKVAQASNGVGGLIVAEYQETSPLTEHMTALLSVLAGESVSFVLVLDDYHLLHVQSVLDAVAYLLHYHPPNLHLFLVSRSEPAALPLSRLRARHQLLELRTTDLRFSREEAAAFLSSSLKVSLSSEDQETLNAQVEGWVVGLQLAALSMQGRQDLPAFVASFAGNHRYIVDYLTDEVLNALPDATQNFLLATSLLDRLCAPLCEAVTGLFSAQEQLEELERGNIFLLPLDDERYWYRYHHLFADVLRQRLHRTLPALVPELHVKASMWYEGQGEFVAAIEHSLAARSYENVARLLMQFSSELMKHGEMFTLQRWLEQLPEALILLYPRLCLYHVWTLVATGQWQQAERRLQDIELNLAQIPESDTVYMLSSLLSARAALAYSHGDTSHAITLSLQALEQVAPDDFSRRSFITLHLGMAYWLHGDMVNAIATIQRAKEESRLANALYSMKVAIYSLAQLQCIQGELRQAYQTYQQGLSCIEERDAHEHPANGFLYYGLGMLFYERNELEQALRVLTRAVDLSLQNGDVRMVPSSQLALGKVKLALGEQTAARKQLEAALQFVREHQILYLFPMVVTALAQFCLITGELAEAEQWLSACALDVKSSMLRPNRMEFGMLARLYLLQGKHADALDLLQRLVQFAECEGHRSYGMQLHVLQARVLYGQGDVAQAVKLLQGVLVSAEPEGYVRLFLDEGPELIPLLLALRQRLLSGKLAGDGADLRSLLVYIQRLLTLLDVRVEEVGKAPVEQVLPDPLSERELEILRLIAHGLSNQEITGHLYIAMSTLKTHINHIYGKLSVRTRTQAIFQARQLKLVE